MGPKPITVPNVVGMPFESAESTLQGAGFAVSRDDVDDAKQPEGIVVGQNPAAGTQQGKGSVITLQVSKGPQTSQVPDVTSQTEHDATTQLTQSGFEVQSVEEIVDTEASTAVCSRRIRRAAPTPSKAPTVMIVVGRFEAATTETDDTAVEP